MKREASIIFGLIAITLVAFGGLGHCGFVNFDDPTYVFLNPHVTGGLSMTNVAWAWKTFYQGNYLPLTWLSLMLDATLFGIGPYGFHWTNIAFHAANAVLLFLVFRQATSSIWRSALVAAIFAVHPLRVESVAWIVERKDVLTGFFCLLAVLAYLRFARSLRHNASVFRRHSSGQADVVYAAVSAALAGLLAAWEVGSRPRSHQQRSFAAAVITPTDPGKAAPARDVSGDPYCHN